MKKFIGPWVVVAGTAAAVLVAWDWGAVRPEAGAEPSGLGALAEMDLEDEAAAAASDFDLVVDFHDDIDSKVLDATPFAEEAVSQYSAVDKLYRIAFDSPAAAREAARSLAQNPAVESVDWNVPARLPPGDVVAQASPYPTVKCDAPRVATQGFPNDPCFQYQWNMRQIGLPDAWKRGQGAGVIVAVIDTGVTAVPDLAGIELVEGFNFVANASNATDDHGHGTHVAGTIAQATNNGLGVTGVAFGAKIMPIKALDASGVGTMASVAQAIRYAADHGAKVINMSLGAPFPIMTIHSAVKYAMQKGAVVVAASGNDGRGRVGYPAKYPEVLAVSAVTSDEKPTFYTNYGAQIAVAAPGGDIRFDRNGDGQPDGILQNTIVPGNTRQIEYLMFMGTSMASPHVAGVAALVAGAGVTQPAAIMDLLRATARKPAGVTWKNGREDHYGTGIVDANAALARAQSVQGLGGMGLAGSLALLGLAGLRRRNQIGRLGPGFVAGLVLGAGGLFFLRAVLPAPLAFATVGVPDMVPTAFAGFAQGSPLLWSALIPFGTIALLAGVRSLRGWLTGAAFGIAGALAVAALTGALDVRFVPDVLDRVFLAGNVVACVLLGRFVARK